MSSILKNIRIGHEVLGAKVTQDGKLILLINTDDSCTVRKVDVESQKPISVFKIPIPPKSKLDIVATKCCVLANNYPKKRIDLYNIEPPKHAGSFDISNYHAAVSVIEYFEAQDRFAVGDENGSITVWSVKEGSTISTTNSLGTKIEKIAFDESGNYLAAALSNNNIIIYEIQNPANRFKLTNHKDRVTTIFFSNKLFFSADASGDLMIWSSQDLSLLKRHKLDPVSSICEAFDKRALLIATKSGKLMILKYENYEFDPYLIDLLGEDICGIVFDNISKKAMLYTKTGKLLFYELGSDESLKSYCLQKMEKSSSDVLRVIVVDDSLTLRKVIISAIKNSVDLAEVYEAKDGKEALKLLENHPDTNIMFLDWNMPTMSGEELMNHIRSNKLYKHTKVVMATTEGGQDKVTKMLRLGVAGYLVKPFRPDAIAKVLQKLIDQDKKG